MRDGTSVQPASESSPPGIVAQTKRPSETPSASELAPPVSMLSGSPIGYLSVGRSGQRDERGAGDERGEHPA